MRKSDNIEDSIPGKMAVMMLRAVEPAPLDDMQIAILILVAFMMDRATEEDRNRTTFEESMEKLSDGIWSLLEQKGWEDVSN